MKKLIFFGTTILFLIIFGCIASEELYSKSGNSVSNSYQLQGSSHQSKR